MTTDSKALMRDWLDIIARGAFDEWPGRVAEDVVLRLPFAPPGVAAELRGLAQVQEVLKSVWSTQESFVWHDVVITRTEDPERVVTTARSEAMFIPGRRYANSYVIFTRFKDAQVVEHTEYFNPLPVMGLYSA
jgi:ketosteroid isomerase-like protein